MPSKRFHDAMRLMLIAHGAGATKELEKKVELACASGARLIQLREKTLEAKPLLQVAQSLRTITANHSAKFIVNSRLDIALAADADALHLPEDALPIQTVRRFFSGLVGRSVHSIEGAKEAEQSGADYLLFGHIFQTASKSFPPRGLKALEEISQSVSIPVYAIGGIMPEHVGACLNAGAFGVAVMNGWLSANDIPQSVKDYLNALNSNMRK